MRVLNRAIPTAELLLARAPEELDFELLMALKVEGNRLYLPSLVASLFRPYNSDFPEAYPQYHEPEVSLAVAEAWSWLMAQCLLIPSTEQGGANGQMQLSRSAKALASKTDFQSYQVSRMLPKDMLHPRIADQVWSAFIRGAF